MKIICAFLLILGYVELSTPLLIGAFNIQIFGHKKADGPVMNHIVKIVRKYHIVLIQEVRDNDLYATKKLMQQVNGVSQSYSYEVSEPLGESNKERYLYIYRNTMVSVVEIFQYPATKPFSRPPFVVMFSYRKTAVQFALIPQHTSPLMAVAQINALYKVALDIRKQWTKNIILLGDFNAGCTYVKETEWPYIPLRADNDYHWLIPDTADTTVSVLKPCPYDRIVATTEMMDVVRPNTAMVYDYRKGLGIDQETALAVSDHFPVEVKLFQDEEFADNDKINGKEHVQFHLEACGQAGSC